MSQYLILIYEAESFYANATPQVLDEVMTAHNRFSEQLEQLGVKIAGGNALQPTATATTVRGDIVTDGPFVETKEALGGYYPIDVESPWPVRTTVSPGSVRSRVRIESTIVSNDENDRPVAPGPPWNRVSPVNTVDSSGT